MSTDNKGLGLKTTRDQVSIKCCLSTKGGLIPRDQEVKTEVSRQSPRGLIYVSTRTPGTGSCTPDTTMSKH